MRMIRLLLMRLPAATGALHDQDEHLPCQVGPTDCERWQS